MIEVWDVINCMFGWFKIMSVYINASIGQVTCKYASENKNLG